jgi:uncharacterized protein (TIGR02145 family)
LQEPYSGIATLLGGAGGETTTGAVLSTTGNNAIVDWVLVELRSAVSAGMVLSSQCALVQRDGDIVGTDGTSALSFPVAPGAYHVAVRHRNHLAVLTAAPVTLSASPLNLDFTNPSTATFGSDARKLLGGVALLWAGDANSDGTISYTGIDNDRDAILVAIGGTIPTATLNGVYMLEDVNMDGIVKYVGLNNDRDVILVNIGGVLPTASTEQQVPEILSQPGAGVTDIDGNTYTTIILNNGQEWMAENLRTATYANGTPIPNVTDNTAWTQLNSGAWSNYSNSPGNDATYGKLYNGYAAANPNICPQGWHMPTDAEWQQLESALGMPGSELGVGGYRGAAQNVGGKMKSTTLWNAPNTGATNESGFSGLPGGLRFGAYGHFASLGYNGYWWSAPESGAEFAYHRGLYGNGAGVYRFYYNKRDGFCLRCVRD